jgi:hypothetical protein
MPPRGRTIGLAALVAASLVPAALFGVAQLREDADVDRYLRDRGLAGLPSTRETALRVSQAVRADFETDAGKWKSLDLARRPFLRHDTAFLLRAREGLCGEGTRVLVSLLARLGFDATRVTLYDAHLQAVHTLVSVRLGARELLVDSINTPEEMNAFLSRADLSTADFRLLHYTDDLLARLEFSRALAAQDTARTAAPPDSVRAAFFGYFRAYSYEALPVTKLLTRAGFDWRVFNLERPARVVSVLAERPRAIAATAWLAFALVFDAVLLLAVRARSRVRVSART